MRAVLAEAAVPPPPEREGLPAPVLPWPGRCPLGRRLPQLARSPAGESPPEARGQRCLVGASPGMHSPGNRGWERDTKVKKWR